MFQLNEILGRRVPVRILVFFLENPSDSYNETDVRTKLELARASASKWLKILFNLKLVNKTIKGRMNLYRLNFDSPVVKQFKILNNLLKIFPSILSLRDVHVFLYGSAARGEDIEDSDVDLLIIGKQSKEVIEAVRKLESELNKRVKPSFYTELEWSQVARKDPAFYERVERDKIKLI